MRRLPATNQPTVRKHRPMYRVALLIGLLLLLGLVVMYAIGPQRANLLNFAYGSDYSDDYFFKKQLVSVAVSLFAFFACSVLPHELFTKRFAKQLFLAGLILSVLLVFMGAVLHLPFAGETNGAYRWLYIGDFSFQPSELLKFGSLVFIAGLLGRRFKQGKINDINETLLPIGIIMAISLFVVVVLQKDLGTGVSLTAIVLSMIVVSGMRAKLIWQIIAGLAVVGVIFIISAPHRLERMTTYIQGDTSISAVDSGGGYHIQQARIAIGSGGLFGLGIGNSVQSTGYLPEAINDSIFAILGETFGFVGLVIILLLFTGLLLSMLMVAARLSDMGLRLVVAGVFGWVGSHVVLNVAAMTGLAPLTGIPLPLLSYGGTSMLFIAAALGLAFQLSSWTTHSTLVERSDYDEDSSSRRRVGRTRHASGRGF